MKLSKIVLIVLALYGVIFQGKVFSQHITNTLGTNGIFKIKDNSTEFFTLSQSTGVLTIAKTLELGNVAGSTSTIGVITKGGERFIHTYFTPLSNGNNTFVGMFSGNFTMSGASYNTGMGSSCLSSLTTGNYNSGFGVNSLRFNTNGSQNTAFGIQTLGSNTTGSSNSALGYNALGDNISGANNSAFGNTSLTNNTIGSYNTAFGMSTLENNISGNSNSSFGYFSLRASTGMGNSGFGNYSLTNATGNNNTALGFNSGDGVTTGSNNITLGYNTNVPTGTANNQVIGNTAITYAGIQVAWTITSDRRWKSNIQNSNLGLDFITKLRPVSYTRINDETQKTEYGFIAQELEETLTNSGAENPGMITIDDKGNYELRYNDLLAPMVKAIQELKGEYDKLKEENLRLAQEVSKLRSLEVRVAELEAKIMKQDVIKEIKSAEK